MKLEVAMLAGAYMVGAVGGFLVGGVYGMRVLSQEIRAIEAARAPAARAGADNSRQVAVAEGELPPGAYVNPGPFPQSQRTWADLFAACRLTDAWLGSTIEGEPVCYPMGQESAP